ncbi:MAG: CxxC-x17-CxxC domain-containing protein [Candidatus Omnitrophota bacterium]
MKKSPKAKESGAPDAVEADIAGLIGKVMQQITFLDKKIDALIAQSAARPTEVKHFSAPSFQRSDRHERHDQGRPDFRDRVLHKAVCADCSKECEVPFKPTGNRPVYCKECFGKRKDDSPFGGRPSERSEGGDRHHGSFKGRREERSGGGEGHQRPPFYKKYTGKGDRGGAKKRPVMRGRRKPKEE